MPHTAKHTPGPWTVKDEDTVIGPQGNIIAECCGYSVRATDKDQIRQGGREANAKFIAAAPAMYETLLQTCKVIEAIDDYQVFEDLQNVLIAINKTLAQAEGEIMTPIKAIH